MSEKLSVECYIAKCRYCGAKIIGNKDTIKELWKQHIDNCEEAKDYIYFLDELEKKGIYESFMEIIKFEAITEELTKLMKKYKLTLDELFNILEGMKNDRTINIS